MYSSTFFQTLFRQLLDSSFLPYYLPPYLIVFSVMYTAQLNSITGSYTYTLRLLVASGKILITVETVAVADVLYNLSTYSSYKTLLPWRILLLLSLVANFVTPALKCHKYYLTTRMHAYALKPTLTYYIIL